MRFVRILWHCDIIFSLSCVVDEGLGNISLIGYGGGVERERERERERWVEQIYLNRIMIKY